MDRSKPERVLMPRHALEATGDPAHTALTSGAGRTPSATRATLVTVVADWNTIAAATSRNAALVVGGAASVVVVAVHNADAVTARRHAGSFSFICPANTEYTVTASSATNLTLTAMEQAL